MNLDAEWILSITWTLYAQKLLGAFAVVNPFSTIPVFVSLTVGYSAAERNKTARAASVAVFVILVVAFILGRYILEFFSISIASFRIAGGLLILMTAFSMLNARLGATKQTDEESQEAQNKENIAIIPLALPLMAGPGAISLMIISSNNTKTLVDHGSVILGVAAIALSVWLILNAGAKISKLLGTTGVNVATRLMGLILAAIAVEFIVSGLGEKFPGLL